MYDRVTYGPFKGYMSALPIHEIPPDYVGTNSYDYRYSPLDGKFSKRLGLAIQGDTVGSLVGLLESKFGARCRMILELESESLADGYPTHAAVFAHDADLEGALYVRSTNGSGGNYVLGEEYGSTHYPTSSGGLNNPADIRFKWVPLWVENTTEDMTRGVDIAQRSVLLAGSRRVASVGKWLFAGNAYGTPMMWNRRWNDSTSSGTEPNRMRPWGAIPPLYAPRFQTATLPTATTSPRPWKEGDQFYVSVAFVHEDGSVSMPYRPQAKFGTARTGEYIDSFGLVTVPSTTASTDYYQYLHWAQIPIGPAGTRGRLLLRTPKIDSTAGQIPAINDLRVCGYIENNTVTQYYDRNGDDSTLLLPEETPYVHFRHAWPWRGRYVFEFDGRVGVGGDLAPNPSAIVIAPTGDPTGVTRSMNSADDGSAHGARWFFFRIYDNAGVKTLQLRYRASIPGVPVQTEITLTSSKSLQDVVDEINATTTASTGGEWVAQVAPGADLNATADNLAYTSGIDFGDDTGIVSDGTTGNVRCWSNAWPGVIYFTQSYMTTLGRYPDRFMLSEGGPALKNVGTYSSAFTFAVGPSFDLKPPDQCGIFMGAWPLAEALMLFYSRGVYLYRNIRGGRSGEDFDYRIDRISSKGCLAWDSIAGGDNWAGWLSEEGYCVSDGQPNNERIISLAVWNPSTQVGEWAYEIRECRAASAADGDGAMFSAHVISGRLYVSYRANAATEPNRMMEYDFSATSGASGLQQVLTPDGQAHGWSTPWRILCGTIGHVRKATFLSKLTANEESSASYSTADGRIDRFDTASDDNGTVIACIAYTKRDDLGVPALRKRCRSITTKHRTTTGGTVAVGFSRVEDGTIGTTYTLASSGTTEYAAERKRVKLSGQTPAKTVQLKFENNSGTTHELFRAEVEVRALKPRSGL